MKGLLFVFAFCVCGFALLWGILVWASRNNPDGDIRYSQRPTSVTVTGSERDLSILGSSRRGGYDVRYRYSVGGRDFIGKGGIPKRIWEPGRARLPVCVDPQKPAEHVLVFRPDAPPCGDPNLGGGRPQTAQPATAPGGP